MAQKKGIKTGGRTKGTPNKITAEIREKFATLVNDNIGKLQDDIDTLKPLERIKIMIELSKFVIPTLKETEFNHIKDLTIHKI